MSRSDVGKRSTTLAGRQARGGLAVAILLVMTLILTACGAAEADEPTATPENGSGEASEASGAIVLGNVDATNPSEKIAEFQPLADYLAANLGDLGISEGQVVIARDTAEMARMLADGSVDIYIDAAIPSLQVCEVAGCEFGLRQWKGGGPELFGVFVTTQTSGIATIDDLRGKVIMLEATHSTVGHILPRVSIAQAGLTTREVESPQAEVGDKEVGYVVSTGGQTSMNLLMNGDIAALAIGERAFKKFDPSVQQQLVIFAETAAAPSQLVAFRPDFDTDLQSEIVALMLALEDSPEGQAILTSLRDTQKFDELPEGLAEQLDELYETVKLTLEE